MTKVVKFSAEIAASYAAGSTLQTLADKYQVSLHAISDALKRAGFQTRSSRKLFISRLALRGCHNVFTAEAKSVFHF